MSHSDEKPDNDTVASNEPRFDFNEMFGDADSPASVENPLESAASPQEPSPFAADAVPTFDFGDAAPAEGGLFSPAPSQEPTPFAADAVPTFDFGTPSPAEGGFFDPGQPEGQTPFLSGDEAATAAEEGMPLVSPTVDGGAAGKKTKKGKEKKPKKPKQPRPKSDRPSFAPNDYLHWSVIAVALVAFILIGVMTPVHGSTMTLVLFYSFYVLCAGLITAIPVFLWKASRTAVLYDDAQDKQPQTTPLPKGVKSDRPYHPGLYDYLLGVALAAMSFAVLALLFQAYSYDFWIKP